MNIIINVTQHAQKKLVIPKLMRHVLMICQIFINAQIIMILWLVYVI